MKKTITLLVAIFATILVLAGCGGTSSPAAAQDTTVHMSGTSFAVSSVSISKGSTITFTTDAGGTPHNLVNGSSGHAAPETGVPDFGTGGKVVATGASWQTGAWTTAGTFHVTCTYHPTTMTITVTVS